MTCVLVIDDDRTVLHLVERGLEGIVQRVETADNGADGLAACRAVAPDVVLLDIHLPDRSGLDLLRTIRDIDRRLPVIFITAGADSESAIEAMQLGAYDYLAKPLAVAKLRDLVSRAANTRRLMTTSVALRTGEVKGSFGDLFIGRSPLMLDVFKMIGRYAQQDVPVLIRGESGTGKELVARAIYQHSGRSDEPFMAVNCAALPDTLLESELFGHEKGSFTSADRRRIGKFEQCSGGTIFLDEVGDMSPLVQGKVLRLLQQQEFERVGGNETIKTDVRIIAATNRPLEDMVKSGEYWSDLIYRLNGVTISLPSLRDRGDDVRLLLQYFLNRHTRELKRTEIEGISGQAVDLLTEYDWPGNVRELESVVRASVLNASGPVIVPDFLPAEVVGDTFTRDAEPAVEEYASEIASPDGLPPSDLRPLIERRLAEGSTDLYAETLEMMERFLMTRVLQETNGNQTKASDTLGITRGKVRDRIAAFEINLDKNVIMR